MTPNAILAAAAVGIFLLLCVVGWHLVSLLQQARQTARAMEQFLTATAPKIETTAEHLSSLTGRVDRFLAAVEGPRCSTGAVGLIGQALAGWAAGVQAVSAISAAIGAIAQAWASFAPAKGASEPAPEAEAPAGT